MIPPLVDVASQNGSRYGIGHDGEHLYIRFFRQNGREDTYRFDGQPKEMVKEMAETHSVGTYIHENLHAKGVFGVKVDVKHR